MRRLFFSLLALVTSCVAMPVAAQTVTIDSICARAYKGEVDSASRRLLASVQKTAPAYQKRAWGRLDARTAAICGVPSAPPAPSARFTATCDTARCTLDARGSSGAIDSFAWHAAGRPDKTGSIIIRNASSDAPSAWDETLTVTDSAGATASVTQRVALVAPSTPPPTTPPPSQPPPPPMGSVAPPIAPVVYNPSPPVVTRTLRVSVGGNLQAALDSAKKGDEIVVAAGATFTGNFTLPAKSGSGWVLVRTSGTLPSTGTRIAPTDSATLARLVSPTVNPALATKASANGWWLRGLDLTTTASGNYGVVLLGDGSSAQTAANTPADLVLEQTWVHGAPTLHISRCVALNSARTAIVDSWLDDCHAKGYDSQAILGWNGPGPFRIENNTLGGAGENVMFGGADPTIAGLIPSDIVIRRNWIYSPPSWKGVFTKKNLLEFKSGQRVEISANVFDGSWADGQNGFALTLKSTNQSKGCTWCLVGDVLIQSNLFRRIGSGVGFSAQDPGVVGAPTSRVAMRDNVMDSLNVGVFTGTAFVVALQNNVQDVSISGLLVSGGSQIKQLLNFDTNPAVTRFSFTDNAAPLGTYGNFCSGVGIGDAAFGCAVGATNLRNVYFGAAQGGYGSASFVATEAQSPQAQAIRARVAAATAGVVRP